MRNLKLLIEYDGTAFCGWQRQRDSDRTVQGELESAIAKLLRHPITLTGAGRTDAGVHARGQVANFHTETTEENFPISRIHYSLNGMLPPDVKILAMHDVHPTFNARFDATARLYRYHLVQTMRAVNRHYVTFYPYPLELESMQQCCPALIGTHDFSSFFRRSSEHRHTSPINPVCTVEYAKWHVETDLIIFEIKANRFLHGMVRLLVGSMLEAGRGRLTPEGFSVILDAKDFLKAKPAAKAKGLFLEEVFYPPS
jgi:tRNA pseudouridine38-40 synthase